MGVHCTIKSNLKTRFNFNLIAQEADKVYYIQYIKTLPVKEARMAEMAVLSGHYQDAENILLQVQCTLGFTVYTTSTPRISSYRYSVLCTVH